MNKDLFIIPVMLAIGISAAAQDLNTDDPTIPEEPTTPEIEYPASMASGTLPVIYINTENGAPVVDKVTPIPATFHMDCSMTDEFDDFASEEEPVVMTIRGRGNWTWQQAKKPYKLKFEKKQSLFGLPKSKHYSLLAENAIRGLTSLCGFELGRMLGMSWTPHFQPVEFVLNGNYEGHYLLIENIKIQGGRVDIYEQPEENTDPETIPYGWLVEVDNYDDEYQVVLQETPEVELKLTHHSPELLSDAQRNWLIDDFQDLLDRLNNDDILHPTWTEKLDAHSLAQYFIVNEIMGNYDGYNGSFYLHKDSGEDAKWTAGPLWDIDNTRPLEGWVFSIRSNENVHLFKQAVRYPAFLNEVKKLWEEHSPEIISYLTETLDAYDKSTQSAVEQDKKRWGDDVNYAYYDCSWIKDQLLSTNYKWLNDNLDSLYPVITGTESISGDSDSGFYICDNKLHLPNPENVEALYISDITGRTTVVRSEGAVDLGRFGSGMYLIRSLDKSGKPSAIKHYVR